MFEQSFQWWWNQQQQLKKPQQQQLPGACYLQSFLPWCHIGSRTFGNKSSGFLPEDFLEHKTARRLGNWPQTVLWTSRLACSQSYWWCPMEEIGAQRNPESIKAVPETAPSNYQLHWDWSGFRSSFSRWIAVIIKLFRWHYLKYLQELPSIGGCPGNLFIPHGHESQSYLLEGAISNCFKALQL